MPPATSVREATPDDLADVTRLLSARDGVAHERQRVSDYLWGLDPNETRTWIAYADDTPVGMTMLYLRDMRWPGGKADAGADDRADDGADEQTVRAGYWAHLYVEPAFRKQMIYPQLVLSMLRSVNAGDVAVIFTATRQPHVAEGHQKLGFKLVGTLPLRLRPLRPLRLVAKHKGIAALKPLAGACDGLYRVFARRRAGGASRVEEIAIDSPDVDRIVALLNDRPAPVNGVQQAWTTARFRRRYHATLDGRSYRITVVRRGEQIVAALVMAIAERGADIRAGVLLELAEDLSVTDREINALHADAEAFAHRDGAELMLSLDDTLLAGDVDASYLMTKSETYHLLVYPKRLAEPPYAAADFAEWAFAFGDHDAF